MNDETIVENELPTDPLPAADRPRYIHPRNVTTLIKRALKAAFPDTRFYVRYSPFGWTRVEWVDGAAVEAVSEIVKQFNGAELDPLTDEWKRRPTLVNGEMVQYGITAIYCDRLTRRQVHKPTRRARLAKEGRS